MSGQRSKKVRMGSSRRRARNQGRTLEADDSIDNTDGTPVVQHHMAEESIESSGALAEFNSSESGNAPLSLSEITGNRGKLGSSRRKKGRQDIEDSVVKLYDENREEVVENTTCHEARFDKRSRFPPSTVEIESASNQSLDFVESDRSYEKGIHDEDPSTRRSSETTCDVSTPCKEETDTVTVSVSLLPQNTETLPKQSDIFRQEKTEWNDVNVEERGVVLDEEAESKCQRSTLATERLEEEMRQGREHDVIASSRHDSSVYSYSTPDQSFELCNDSSVYSYSTPDQSFELCNPTVPTSSEVFPDGLIPKSGEELIANGTQVVNEEKLEPSHFCESAEINFEETGRFHTRASKGGFDDVRDAVQLDGTSRFISNSAPSLNQPVAKSQTGANAEGEALGGVHAVLNKEESKETEGTMEWVKPRGNLKGNYLVNESPMKVKDTESPIQEKNSPVEHRQSECTVENTRLETVDVSEQSLTPDAPNIFQSRQDTPDKLDQNSDDDENPHLESNLTGRRRKMGSSRRNLRGRHEEKNTERMQEDETGSSQIVQEKRGGMTTEVNSSAERDDPIGSTERVGEDETERSLKGELQNTSELTGYEEPEIMDFFQSQTTLFHKEEDSRISDVQNVSDYDDKGKMNSTQDTLDVLDQEVSQDRNMDSMLTDIQAAREEAYLEQTDEVEEGLEEVKVPDLMEIRPKQDMEEEGPVNTEVDSEKDEAGELFVETAKEANKAQEIDISYEDTYRQTLPAAHIENVLHETLDAFDISPKEELTEVLTKPEALDASEQSLTPDAPNILQSRQDTPDKLDQNSDDDENPHLESNLTGRRRKMGSSRRNLRGRHEEKNTERMQEDETGSSQIVQEKRGGMTTEVISSSERDDPIGSTERVGEDETERSLKGELQNTSELTGYEEPEIMDFLQSQTTLFHKEEDSQTSDVQNVSDYGDKGNMNSRQDTLDVLNQEVSQDRNMDSMLTDIQAAREQAYLEQSDEVEEGLEEVKVPDLMEIRPTQDMEEEGPGNTEVDSEKDEAVELFVETAKEANKAQEIDISYEDTYRQTLPAAHIENVLHETLDAFDISHKEELTEVLTKPEALDASEQSLTPDAPNILQSRQDTPDKLDQNSDDDENPHLESNLTGRRRKMGSSRRNLRGRHEEKNTEKMQEDETGSSQIVQEKRGGMTTEVHSSSERDDPIGSTERVGEDETERSLKGELQNTSELTGYEEPEIMDFLQSQTTLFHKEEDSRISDVHNVSDYGDKGNINSRQDTLDVLNQEVSQDRNMDSMLTDIQAAREEAHLEQTDEVEEGLEEVKVPDLMEIRPKQDMEEEGPVNTEVDSEKDEAGELFVETAKEANKAQEIDISYEVTYRQTLPAAHIENVLHETLDAFDISHKEELTEVLTKPEALDASEQSLTPDAPNILQSRQDTPDKLEQNSDDDENPHLGSNLTGRRRKMGSSRRNLRGRHEEKNTEKMQENETGSSQIVQEKRGGMTTEVISSAERDDPIGSTERVGEDETERSLKCELQNTSELTGYEEPEIMYSLQSQTTLFHKEDSRISDVGPVNTKVDSERKEDREQSWDQVKEDHIAQDIYEQTYSQVIPPAQNENLLSHTLDTFDTPLAEDLTEPAVHVFQQHSTSDADAFNVHQNQQDRSEETKDGKDVTGGPLPAFTSEMTGDNDEEATEEPTTARRRKLGSTRRAVLHSKNVLHSKHVPHCTNVQHSQNVLHCKNVLHSRNVHSKNVDVSEERLGEEREVVEKSKVTGNTSVSGPEQTEMPLDPAHMPSDLTIKEDNRQQEVSDLLDIALESNTQSSTADSMPALSEETGNSSHSEDVANRTLFIPDSGIYSGVEIAYDPMALSSKPWPQLDAVMATDAHISTTAFESSPLNLLLQSSLNSGDCLLNTDPTIKAKRRRMTSSRRTARGAQEVERRPEEVATQDQEERSDIETLALEMVKSQMVKSEDHGAAGESGESALVGIRRSNTPSMQEDDVSEGADETASETEPSRGRRRRKMGSTRRSLRVRPEEENLDVRQEGATEVAEVAKDVATIAEGALDVERIQSPLNVKLLEDEFEKQRPTLSAPGASHSTPMAHRSLSPECGAQTEAKVERRRRKMGSTRKLHQHGLYTDPAENQGGIRDTWVKDLETITENVIKTSDDQMSGSTRLPEKTEVDESEQRPASKNDSDCLSQRAPGQPAGPRNKLVQEREKTQPLGFSKELNLGTKQFNVVMVGNCNVGKTSFIKRAENGEFCPDLSSSIGIDTSVQSVTVDGKTVVLQFWDTAGQERFRSLTRQVFHRAQAFVLMYDITSSQSFCDVRYWVTCIQEGAADDIAIVLLGNKSDCAKREVDSDQAEALAKEHNMVFLECSAATGDNVLPSMEAVARVLSQRFRQTEDGMELHKTPQQKKKSGCC